MVYGLFAKGQLPHPPIPLSVFLVVEEALCAAWDRLRTYPKPGFNLLSAEEDVVTLKLHEQLFDVIFDSGAVEGFDAQLFQVGSRAGKVRNYDETSLDKMPDLLIGLIGRRNVFMRTQDGLFVECKPVDSAHSVGTHYCDKGIIRFVRGDYAWAMTSALMIGYARGGYTISSTLTIALRTDTRARSLLTIAFPCQCRQSKPGRNNEAVYVSEHSRTFRYVETKQQAPPITIRHLWLRRD
jgi:hypothetical protein